MTKAPIFPSQWLPMLLLAALLLVPMTAVALDAHFYIGFMTRILIYALAASALNLVLGYVGLVGFGHALFVGLGAYCVSLASLYGLESAWPQLALALVSCAVVGLVTGAISLRTRGIGFIMITLAFSQMGYYVFVSLKNYGGDDGMSIAVTSQLGLGLDLGSPTPLYYATWIALAATLLWMHKVRQAPFGMALRGSRQNQARISAIGFPARRFQLIAYVVSAMVCGVAGILLANLNAYASPALMSWQLSGELIVIVVIGGMGTVFGPFLGALLFIGLEEIMKSQTEHWMLVVGPIIVLVALAGRDGVMGGLHWLDGRWTGLAASGSNRGPGPGAKVASAKGGE
ncbi:branched-chain amino acid ABC transporter permease [Telluria beijingensis]|uniref:branched-chain amino acid ABC transporter permease n=1 Tax=Telluria beijingensis TaxID=3068633 RepID=UPI002795733A|nr:branched-chain amino acid ABC transporter permease [Massilia sp. REN29]